jgi:hypothetical protein
MKRVIIICEGQTEKEFCKDILFHHLFDKGIQVQTPLIKKSGGGLVSWDVLRSQIEKHLKEDQSAHVTTFIDFYGISNKHRFPKWGESKNLTEKLKRMDFLEDAMKESVEGILQSRFEPYIQLHEFEGLLFNDISYFSNQIAHEDFFNKDELEITIHDYPNPELINDTPNNAPSYRLKRLIKGYNKIVHGTILAKEIGLERIRTKCFRFNEWISKLENL